jgi:hypothetical protein
VNGSIDLIQTLNNTAAIRTIVDIGIGFRNFAQMEVNFIGSIASNAPPLILLTSAIAFTPMLGFIVLLKK